MFFMGEYLMRGQKMSDNNAKRRWFLHDAAAATVQRAFPSNIKAYQGISRSTLYHARSDGGALTTVARMVMATKVREEAEHILKFVSDVVQLRHGEGE